MRETKKGRRRRFRFHGGDNSKAGGTFTWPAAAEDGLWAPEMKTKAEREEGRKGEERGEILQIPTVTEGDGAGNGATRRRPGERVGH